MPLPTYCPLGSPSLLNGDFTENVARLKDFSWSVIFSSDPNVSNETARTVQNLVGVELCELISEHPKEFVIANLLILLYFIVFVLIVATLTSFLKITKSRVDIINLFAASMFISLIAWMMINRMFPNDIRETIIYGIYDHILIIGGVLHFRCLTTLVPSISKKKISTTYLNTILFIFAVLLFLFSPVNRSNITECPPMSERFASELFFWFQFVILGLVYLSIGSILLYSKAESLEILKNFKHVGKMVKKGEFGWIEHYNELASEPSKTETV